MNVKKLKCFSDKEWMVYLQELQAIKNHKTLDICYDCTVEFQVRMRKEGRCDFPMKRVNNLTEYV
jgi:hypothetical protein